MITLVEFYKELEESKRIQEDANRLWWQKDSKGLFRVSSAYKLLNQDNKQMTNWPWKHIWEVKIPFKVACFTGLLAKEAVLTQDNLSRRGISLCSRCYLCGEDSETVKHLFLKCRTADMLWKISISLRGIAWTMPRKNKLKFCLAGKRQKQERHTGDRWRIVPACLW